MAEARISLMEIADKLIEAGFESVRTFSHHIRFVSPCHTGVYKIGYRKPSCNGMIISISVGQAVAELLNGEYNPEKNQITFSESNQFLHLIACVRTTSRRNSHTDRKPDNRTAKGRHNGRKS